jgi:hypothetical protein
MAKDINAYRQWLEDAQEFMPVAIQSGALAQQHFPQLVQNGQYQGYKPGAGTTTGTGAAAAAQSAAAMPGTTGETQKRRRGGGRKKKAEAAGTGGAAAAPAQTT